MIHSRVHALISSIEQLQDAGQYYGDADALLDLVDCCGHDRPVSYTHTNYITPWTLSSWGTLSVLRTGLIIFLNRTNTYLLHNMQEKIILL